MTLQILGQKKSTKRYESIAFYFLDNNRLAKVQLFRQLAKKMLKNLHSPAYVDKVSRRGY